MCEPVVRRLSIRGRDTLDVVDPRAGPEQLMRVARMFELNGDAIGAIVAYREVILAGEETTSAEARRRVADLARRASAQSPV